MANNYPRGSEWRKWDLHVHTPASFHWNAGKKLYEMTPEEKEQSVNLFIDTVNKSKCVAFAVMDYWTFDWISELRKYTTQHNDELKKMIFPGMELRVECPVDYRLNIHVLLSDQTTNQQLIDFKSKLQIRIGSQNKNLSNDSLIELAKSLSADKAKIHGFNDPKTLSHEELLQLGSRTAVVTRDSLTDAFTQIPKNSGYIVMPYDTSDGLLELDWSKHPQDDNYFMQTAQIFETRDQRNIDLFCGVKTEENKSFFANFYKTLGEQPKPSVSGSDAHKFADYGNFPSDRCTWIKADPTFDGLKQVVNEPEDRIFIGKIPPKLVDVENNKSHYIDSITLDPINKSIQHPWFNNITPLNPGLVAIIGKKGSGKSAKADSIALAGKSHVPPENYSFLRDDKFRKKGLAKQYAATLTWHDGVPVKINLGDQISIATEPEQIKYLPQKFVETVCNESGINLFQQEIDKVIFSYVPEEDKQDTTNLRDLIKLKTGLIDRNIETLRQKVGEQNELICKLEEKQLSSYLESVKNRLSEKQRELKNLVEPKKVDEPKSKPSKDVEDKINSLNSDLEATEKAIEEKQQELKVVNQHITKLQNIEISLENIQQQLNELLTGYTEDFKLLNIDQKKLIVLKVDNKLISGTRLSLNTRKTNLTNLLSEKGDEKTSLLLKKKAILASLKTIYDGLDKENGAYRDYLKNLKAYQDKKAAIEGVETDTGLMTIKSLTKEVDYVQNSLPKDIKDAEAQRDNTVKNVYDELDKKITFYKDIYAPLGKIINDKKEKQKKTGSVLDFNVGIVFDKLNFPNKFLAFIDQSKDGSFQGKAEGYNRVKEIIVNNDLKTKSGVESFIKELIDSLRVDISTIDKVAKLLDNQLIKNGSEKLDFYNFLYGLGYLEVKYNITFNGKDLNENEFSPGEIGALLLIFYLLIDKDKIPLIIDQPEENLDNESVFTLLVPYIKQAKKERQIIIVTHNPNIAVVCDAEQIIVAEMNKHDYEIRYSSGSIENGDINNRIVNILEGTMPAFNNRKNKYMKLKGL